MIMSDRVKTLNLQNTNNKKREMVRELNKKAFGKYIAGLRAKRADVATQELLAEKLVISTSYVEKIESGKRVPSPEILAEMADLLGVRPSELMAVLADEPPGKTAPALPMPDQELIAAIIKSVLEYLKNTDNLAGLQEIIGAVMNSNYDKKYNAVQPIVKDVAEALGVGDKKPTKARSFKERGKPLPPPDKAKKNRLTRKASPVPNSNT